MLKLSAPLYCYLELTPECNNHCSGCSNVFVDDKHSRYPVARDYLTADMWGAIIRKLKPHVKSLRITGGEASLHPEFETIIENIQANDIPFVVFTNGRWHDPAKFVALLQRASQFEGLLVSLHGADAQAHEAFSGIKGSFEETLRNIQYASQLGITINTNTVITRANLGQLEAIVNLSQAIGAHYSVFNRYIGVPVADLSVAPSELRDAVRRIDQMKTSGAHIKFGVCLPQCFERNSSTGCLAGNAFWSIDPWGNVRPCNHAPIYCGNLVSSTVAEIAGGGELAKWHSRIPMQCAHCSMYAHCRGGCRAQALLSERGKDDLMGTLIRRSNETEQPVEMTLARHSRPIPKFDVRRENFGYVLIRGNNFVPVTEDAKALLDECNGCLTLGEIYERFGDDAIEFVASLHSEGFIDLALDSPLPN